MEDWEQSRFLGYIIAKGAGSKISKVTDLIKFPWEQSNEKPKIMTKEEMKRLQDKAKWILNNSNILLEDQ